MSAEVITQPLAASEHPNDDLVPLPHQGAYVDAAIQTSTHPSTTIGAATDTNHLLAGDQPLDASHSAAVPNPFVLPHQSLPGYHKPIMSQSQGAFEDDAALFGQPAVSEPGPIAEAPVNDVSEDIPSNEHAEDPKESEAEVRTDENSKITSLEPAAPVADAAPHEVAQQVPQEAMAVDTKDDSVEMVAEAAVEEEKHAEEPHTEVENGHDDNKSDSLVEMTEKERDLEHLQQSLEEQLAAQIDTTRKASPPKRATRRGGRPVSASQGVHYDYGEGGTLGADSEDEDGGWGSDDEIRATQQAQTFKRSHSNGTDDESYKMDVDHDDEDSDGDYEAVETHEEDDEPSAKRKKVAEPVDVDEEITIAGKSSKEEIRSGQGPAEEEDDVIITKLTVKPNISVIDSDDEGMEVMSANRPRPTLGSVGAPAKTSKSISAKSKKAAATTASADSTAATTSTASNPSTPAKSKAKAMATSSAMDVSVEEASGGTDTSTEAKNPTITAKNAKENNATSATTSTQKSATKSNESSTPSTPSKAKASSTKPTTPSKSSSSKMLSPPKSSPRKKKINSMEEDEEPEELFEEASPRPKRQLRSASPSATQSQKGAKKTKIPTAELAQLLRAQARESIALYLQNHSDDMSDFFTQRHVKTQKKKDQEPPKTMFRGIQFVVTGLRNVDEHITPDFVKMQIKVLGGSLVNFRSTARGSSEEWRTTKRAKEATVDADVLLPRCILISEKPQRTLKYITALVNGVPCVHYRWFLACLHQGHLIPIDDFLLPAGYNEDAAVIPSPYWIAREDQSDIHMPERFPFIIDDDEDDEDEDEENGAKNGEAGANGGTDGAATKSAKATPKIKRKKRSWGVDAYRIEVIGIPAFQAQWKQTLKAAGARIVSRMDAVREDRIDFIVSDTEPTDLMIKIAKERKLPLCTIDWALQTIIQRKIQDPFAKPAYTLNIDD